jgi:shikimate dehydrogenase
MELEPHIDSQPPIRVGLIGDPVAHSYSPRFQQAAFDACGIPARYELWQTSESELPARVASLLAPRALGANISIPYKEAVLPLLDVVDPLAGRIGAVNTIVHRNEYLYGYNTDAPGLLYALVELDVGKLLEPHQLTSLKDTFSFEGYTVVLLGAGGAARGAAFALANASVERLVIVNRNLERAQRLAAEVQQESNCQVFCLNNPAYLIPHQRSIIINATSIGMHVAGKQGNSETENASPLPAEILARFAPDTLVFDMVYNPTQTQLLCQARTLGLRSVNGLLMLLRQGALAFTLWTGQPAPFEVMRSTLL